MKIRLIPMEKKSKVVMSVGKIVTAQEALDFLKEADLRAAISKKKERTSVDILSFPTKTH